MEDSLHIHKFSLLEVDGHTGSDELLCEHRDIKTVGVEAPQITTFDVVGKRLCNLAEGGLIGHVGICDVVNCRSIFGDVHHLSIVINRFDATGLDNGLIAAGHNFDKRNLYYPIFDDIYTCGFEIEKDNRIFQIKFHRLTYRIDCYALIIIGINSISVLAL